MKLADSDSAPNPSGSHRHEAHRRENPMTAEHRTANGLRRRTTSAEKPASRVSRRNRGNHGAPNPSQVRRPTAVLMATALLTRATAITADAYGRLCWSG